jgi:hypothetical protein
MSQQSGKPLFSSDSQDKRETTERMKNELSYG